MRVIDFTLADAAVVARDTCAKENIMDDISTIRCLQYALNKFGIDVELLSTKVVVFNPYITKEFKPGNAPSKKRLSNLLNHRNGFSSTLGASAGNDWQGHLVLIANNLDGKWLIDPTLNQLNSSQHNLWMLPIGVSVNNDFGTYDGSRAILRLNDCAVIYSAFPNSDFQNSTQWKLNVEEFDAEAMGEIIFNRLVEGK